MTGADFEAEGLWLLGGRGWQTRFGAATGTDTSTIRRWIKMAEVPEHASAIMEFLRLVPAAMRPGRWVR